MIARPTARLLAAIVLTCAAARAALAPFVLSEEVQARDAWLDANWKAGGASALPFSFTFDGKKSSDLLPKWNPRVREEPLDESRVRQTTVWTDPATGLEVRAVAVRYGDYPTVEWTLHFKNTGAKDTPVLEQVEALNGSFRKGENADFVLHSFEGSAAHASDYAPSHTPLPPHAVAKLHSDGKPSVQNLPYFNLDFGGQGIVAAVGWPGSWYADLTRDGGDGIAVRASLSNLAAVLKPGEEVRSPLIVLQFWKTGDWVRAQNVWRRWMMAHNLPRLDGKIPEPFTATCIDGNFPGMLSNAADEIRFMDLALKHQMPLDYWWIDAGWYATTHEWVDTGTWEPDPKRYPRGLKEVADHAHENKLKFVVWFEPERVHAGTCLFDQRPQWLIGSADNRLLNLGNPEAFDWAVEHFDGLIKSQNIDIYRQDYNINPGDIWQHADTPDRRGITENHYVQGYLAYWDELRRRNPHILIDSCASGGQRNDLETLRRSLPLLRSDYRFEPNGTQGHNYGFSFWEPFNGTGVEPADPYVMRSHFCACFAYLAADNNPNYDYAGRRKIALEWYGVRDNYLGDYYPLTDYTLAPNVWMAWQFDRPEAGRGVVQVFRRAEEPRESERFKLRGLDAAATYTITIHGPDYDAHSGGEQTGDALMKTGLEVRLEKPASAVTVEYQKKEATVGTDKP